MAKNRSRQSAQVDRSNNELKDEQVATKPEDAKLPDVPEQVILSNGEVTTVTEIVATSPEGEQVVVDTVTTTVVEPSLGTGCLTTITPTTLATNGVKSDGEKLLDAFFPPSCPNCNVALPEGFNYCGKCGKKAVPMGTYGGKKVRLVSVGGERQSNGGGGTGGQQRYSIFGHSAAAFLRWLGSKGCQPKQAAQILEKHGCHGVSKNTIATQLRDGRKGSGSKLPQISEEIEKQVFPA